MHWNWWYHFKILQESKTSWLLRDQDAFTYALISHLIYHSCRYSLKTYSWKHSVKKVVSSHLIFQRLKNKNEIIWRRNTESTSVFYKQWETLPPLWTQNWHCLFWDSCLQNKECLCHEPKQEKRGRKKFQEKMSKIHAFSIFENLEDTRKKFEQRMKLLKVSTFFITPTEQVN